MVLVIDKQSFFPIDQKWIEDTVNIFLEKLDLHDWQVSVVLLDCEEMAEQNSRYRGKVGPTDILSFPFLPNLEPGKLPEIDPEKDVQDLGDIIICPEQIAKDAKDLDIGFEQRFKRMLAHGLAHLLGYDHQTDEQYALMKPLEEKLLGRNIDD